MKFPPWLLVSGDTSYRNKKCPSESAEQITLFNIIRKEFPHALHPRNEGVRTMQQVQRQKAEGMTPGAADIIIPGKQTFVCELKRQDHTLSSWQPKQLEFLESCHKSGAFVCVALGYKSAIEAIEEWKEKNRRSK
jgi:hypothetical protein